MSIERFQTVDSVLDETDNRLKAGQAAGAKVWLTSLPMLDKALAGGFPSGELVLLGGGQGLGKTTFALQVMRNLVATADDSACSVPRHPTRTSKPSGRSSRRSARTPDRHPSSPSTPCRRFISLARTCPRRTGRPWSSRSSKTCRWSCPCLFSPSSPPFRSPQRRRQDGPRVSEGLLARQVRSGRWACPGRADRRPDLR